MDPSEDASDPYYHESAACQECQKSERQERTRLAGEFDMLEELKIAMRRKA